MPEPLERTCGVLTPVFALRGPHDAGIGDVGALLAFARQAAELGLGFIQILPINATGNDPSPYNAISSKALDPLLLDISPATFPELDPGTDIRVRSEHNAMALSARDRVDYPAVRNLKYGLLRAAFERFETSPTADAADFERFLREHASWLDAFSLFRTLMEMHGGSERWDTWPEPCQRYASAAVWLRQLPEEERRAIDSECRFHSYIQWRAFGQWIAAKAELDRIGVRLMGDIPFGVGYYSADVFAEPDLFDLTWSGGAPPEPWFKEEEFTRRWGQNWGIPLYRWDVMAADNFAWWRRRVGTAASVMHAFRIDHILGFYRIYRFPWRPEENADYRDLPDHDAWLRAGERFPGFFPRADWPDENGVLNRADGDVRLRAIQEAAGPSWVVAEDLGAVPDYMRPHLGSLGIPGITIPIWTKSSDGTVKKGCDYPKATMATYGTHDHEPLRAAWNRWHALHLDPGAAPDAVEEARGNLRDLTGFAGITWENGEHEFDMRTHRLLLRALLDCNADLVVFMITDLLGRTERFNTPGAVGEMNWSWRLPKNALWQTWEGLPLGTLLNGLLKETGRI